MPEQITLQQISELMDQKLTAQEARMDQKFDSLEARMDQKFEELKEYVDDSVHHAIESAVAIVQVNMEEQANRIINRAHVLVENTEGKQIRLLNELTQQHKGIIDDHERRILKLEEAAG